MSYAKAAEVRAPLSRHPAFVPLVALWLAALLSGSVAVLPAAMLRELLNTSALPLAQLPSAAVAAAALAAVAGAAAGWAGARTIKRWQHRAAPVVAAEAPVEQDEPVEAQATVETAAIADPAMQPFASPEAVIEEAEPRILSLDELPALKPVGPEPEILSAPAPECEAAVSEGLSQQDVFEQGALDELLASLPTYPSPVEAEADLDVEEEPEPVACTPELVEQSDTPLAAPARHGKAVQLLRGTGTSQLAMPQLIERFAVALDDAGGSGTNTYLPGNAAPNMVAELRALSEAL